MTLRLPVPLLALQSNSAIILPGIRQAFRSSETVKFLIVGQGGKVGTIHRSKERFCPLISPMSREPTHSSGRASSAMSSTGDRNDWAAPAVGLLPELH